MKPTQTLVVNGATGGLGSAAVLVGLAMGASKVVAVGRNEEKLKALEQLVVIPNRNHTIL